MPQETTLEGLAATIRDLLAETAPGRLTIAIAGAPGAGKSTFAERLERLLNAALPGTAAILPMDGFHYDDLVLEARGHRRRKGAPHTFDVDGFTAALDRLRADDGRDVAVPVFDRAIEIARAGARIIGPEVRILLVEGNYLLLDDPAWAPLRSRFHRTVMLDVPAEILEERLTGRWRGFGLEGEAMVAKMEGNDLPNMRLVVSRSVPADFVVRNH